MGPVAGASHLGRECGGVQLLPSIPHVAVEHRLSSRVLGEPVADHHRHLLARGLIRTVREAESREGSVGSALPVHHVAVHDCRDDLLELAERLLAATPVQQGGLDGVATLIEDASSPLYQGCDLRGAVRDARRALDRDHQQ
jgi:hypothetical protein